MTEHEYTPKEFERLMTLPEDHPDRVAAAASPRFEAARRMLAEFESPGDHSTAEPAVVAATTELRRRLIESGSLAASAEPATGTAPPPSPGRRPVGGFMSWLRVPAGRAAFAMAGALIVAGAGWWATHRGEQVSSLRGEVEPGRFEFVSHVDGDALVLRWGAVQGADAYRIVFLGADLGELAHVDVPNVTTYSLRARDLPAGSASGTPVSLEVAALREDTVVASTPARTVLLP